MDRRIAIELVQLILLLLFAGGGTALAQAGTSSEGTEKEEALIQIHRAALRKDRARDEKERLGLKENPKVQKAYERSADYKEFHKELKRMNAGPQVLRAFADEAYRYQK